jgi:hypothetical protein
VGRKPVWSGCASVDFAIEGRTPPSGAGMEILADFEFRDPDGNRGGIFVFAKAGQLAGIAFGRSTATRERMSCRRLIDCSRGKARRGLMAKFRRISLFVTAFEPGRHR